MKRVIILIGFMLIVFTAAADGLNDEAQLIKEKLPEAYSVIIEMAEEKWPGNSAMILNEVNRQAEAFLIVVQQSDSWPDVAFFNALCKWTEGGEATVMDDSLPIIELPTNWRMVAHEVQRQMDASAALQ